MSLYTNPLYRSVSYTCTPIQIVQNAIPRREDDDPVGEAELSWRAEGDTQR